MNIQWYPGHMAKATRLIREDLKNVDLVIKLLDARAVVRSENQDFNKVIKNKKTINVYNKTDLADDRKTAMWKEYFRETGEPCFFVDSLNRKGFREVTDYLKSRKFRTGREIRAMVIGIPNVGKSFFINAMTGKKNAQTGNRPGVTKSKQWIKLKGEFYLLDTPGILPPKFENEQDGICLASIGCVKETILDREELCLKLLEYLMGEYPELIMNRYRLESLSGTPLEVYEDIGRKRGFLLKGGEIDYLRTAVTVLDEFKNGKIGKMSFDSPGGRG